MKHVTEKITASTVRADFNAIEAVLHYTRAAHSLGLWKSERILIERFFPDRGAAILEAGCGAGRVTLGLWRLGYRNLTAFDFAGELLEQAISLAADHDATSIRLLQADATTPELCHLLSDKFPGPSSGTEPEVCHPIGDKRSGTAAGVEAGGPVFDGALFLFNGLMQIPGRGNRRAAMRNLASACRAGAPFLFTTHDRDDSPDERKLWQREQRAWSEGRQDRRLVDFGDRYFESPDGRIFMHLPDQAEIREDLLATGWELEFTAMRREIARESRQVRDFSDECRFWMARRGATEGGGGCPQPPGSHRARGTCVPTPVIARYPAGRAMRPPPRGA